MGGYLIVGLIIAGLFWITGKYQSDQKWATIRFYEKAGIYKNCAETEPEARSRDEENARYVSRMHNQLALITIGAALAITLVQFLVETNAHNDRQMEYLAGFNQGWNEECNHLAALDWEELRLEMSAAYDNPTFTVDLQQCLAANPGGEIASTPGEGDVYWARQDGREDGADGAYLFVRNSI